MENDSSKLVSKTSPINSHPPLGAIHEALQMEAEFIQDLHGIKQIRVYVFDESMSPSDVRSNLLDDSPYMGSYKSWVKFTQETEPIDPSTADAEPIAVKEHHIVKPNEAKASKLHDEIKLRVIRDDVQAAPQEVLDICEPACWAMHSKAARPSRGRARSG